MGFGQSKLGISRGGDLFGESGIWPFDSLQPQIDTRLILLQPLARDGFS